MTPNQGLFSESVNSMLALFSLSGFSGSVLFLLYTAAPISNFIVLALQSVLIVA